MIIEGALDGYQMLIENGDGVGDRRPVYIGVSAPGVTKSSAGWQIQKLTYDTTSDKLASRVFADNSPRFSKVWNNRGNYTYTIAE